ncbi:MAG: tryptophan--tRNA ligase [Patescibacteria group bacterium]
MSKKIAQRVLSGIRATGRLHLGNYLGAVKGMLELQDSQEYETLYMVADVHTITTPYDVATLRQNRREVMLDYLAAGLNPDKSILFQQSMVNEHLELAFYFSSLTTVAKMQHLPTFKEKVKQHPDHVTMALLNYPALMAADILIYKAGLVPVGLDQEPHLEATREIARRFNQEYGTDFPEPQRFVTSGEYVPSLAGAGKMSKSVEGSYITLTDDLKTIQKRLSAAPTDSGKGTIKKDAKSKSGNRYIDQSGEESLGVANMLTFVELFQGVDRRKEYEALYKGSGIRYGDLKKDLAAAIFEQLAPIQEHRKELEANPRFVNAVIAGGADRAREIAQNTVAEVREVMGLG